MYYADHTAKLNRRKRDVLDEYAATDPVDFFAFATETFFEKSRKVVKKYAQLYEDMRGFYQVDPDGWF